MSYGRNRFDSEEELSDKMEEQLKQLTKDNHRLREERNQLKEEVKKSKRLSNNDSLDTKLKIKDLEVMNKTLSEENLELRIHSSDNKRKYMDFSTKVEIYKERNKNEMIRIGNELQTETNLRKSIESKNEFLIKQRDEMFECLSNEKMKSRESLHCKGMVNELNKTIKSLTQNNKDLENKLIEEMKKRRESAQSQPLVKDLHKTINNLKVEVKNQMEVNKKQKMGNEKEIKKMKSGFVSQITALKKQRVYFQRCNETNKRKHLSTQYSFAGHQKMYNSNASKIHESIQKNTNENFDEIKDEIMELLEKKSKKLKAANLNDVADVVRSNVTNSEQIMSNANAIIEKADDETIACPQPECDSKFYDITQARNHLQKKHFKNWDKLFGPSTDANHTHKKIIDCIDLLED